jgi:D-psicose/D-tagatose/L-ribulose 3-epimerase
MDSLENKMKFGINTFVWVSPFKTEVAEELAEKVKKIGFNIIELSCEQPSMIDVSKVNKIIKEKGLDVVVCGAFGLSRNLCSEDPQLVQNAKEYIIWLINAAAELGAKVVAGPMYSSVGKAHYDDPVQREKEWDRAVKNMRELADYAASKDVKLALETLNRFETDMINTVSQGLDFINDIGRENVGLHLDTFHMHLEEKSSADAIRLAGDKIFHFHACENDRGIPGSGQVHWVEIFRALKEIEYPGPIVIESFSQDVKEIARAVCIWREIAPSQDAIAIEGLEFLKASF